VNNQLETMALLGTSADPPTIGHQQLLKELLNLFPKVATWASDNPMKQHVAPLEQRCILLKTLVQAINNPRLQLVQELSSPWAITTLERAKGLWPGVELVFVIGSDLAAQIPTWRDFKAVLEHSRLAIAPRRGWPLENADLQGLEAHGGRIEVLPLQIPASASSLARRQPDRAQIPAALWPMLQQHNLYGLTPGL